MCDYLTLTGFKTLLGLYSKLRAAYIRMYLNEVLIGFIWHEFGHSFVNPLSEKYADKVSSLKMLFEPIKNSMSKQSYGNWTICVNEHIDRAVTVRLVELYMDSQLNKVFPLTSLELVELELSNHFIYIKPLIEKLKDFEKQRDETKITFSEFYPELLNVLDSLQKIEYWKQFEL